MRSASLLFLVLSLACYALAFGVKLGLLSPMETRPVALIDMASLNALIAIAFGVLGLNPEKR